MYFFYLFLCLCVQGSQDQLKEVWHEADGLDPEDFDPKTFFKMHGNYRSCIYSTLTAAFWFFCFNLFPFNFIYSYLWVWNFVHLQSSVKYFPNQTCSESREQVEESLERWRFDLERRGGGGSYLKWVRNHVWIKRRQGEQWSCWE